MSLSFEQELEHTITITGIEDSSGNAISNNRNYGFIHDRLAPKLVGILVLSPTTILVEFSEAVDQSIAENANNFWIDNGVASPKTAAQSPESLNEVLLTFTTLGNNDLNTLTISNISDVFSNILPVELTTTFRTNTVLFGSLTIISNETLQFQFNKYLDQAAAEFVDNYAFDNGVGLNSITLDENDPSIVKMNLNISLVEGVNYRIVAQNLIDTDGNTSATISHDFQYDALISSISILSQNSILVAFKKDIDETTAETTSNFSIDGGIGNPLTAVRNNALNNEITLFFNTALTEDTDYTLSIQNLLDSYGGKISGSNNSINYDASAPFITAINATFSNEIEVVFNEAIDPITAQTINHYSLDNGIGRPTSAIHSTLSLNTVVLQFASDLIDGTNYQLNVDRVEDSQGKAINKATYNFNFKAVLNPFFRDLVVNEVYFDTDPDAGIPNIEYIELYNRSRTSYELRGLSLSDSRDTAAFTAFTIAPDSYLIVTSLAGKNNFISYGDVLGISNFPSLSNAGETIRILDRNNSVIDSLNFNSNYYNDSSKEDGGYSVELINPDESCFDLSNYGASTNSNGGTPGIINSIYDNALDITEPVISNLAAISTTELQLTFSESIDVSTLIPDNFGLQNGVSVSSIEILDDFGLNISLHLNLAFQKGSSRTLILNNVADCAGNAFSNSEHTFLIGATPGSGDIIITEIMATPGPSNGLPENEYVELYNPTSSILALEGIILSDDNRSITLSAYNLYPDSYLILSDNNGVAALSSYGNTLGSSSFPTLAIADRVRIESPSNELIFEVNYDKSFYHDETKEAGGYSMEMINSEAVCFDDANWTASLNIAGGSPGIQNSVYDLSPDSSAPEILNVEAITDLQIKVTFNESMDVSTILGQNFLLSDGLIISNLDIQTEFGSEVLINLSTPFIRGTEYFLNLIGLTDCTGNALPTTNEVFYLGAAPSLHELIITEIMATPGPSNGLPENEYVELYNPTSSILALEGIILSDDNRSITLSAYNLYPDSYLILSDNNGVAALSSYGNTLGSSSFPTLAIADRVRIESPSNELIFEVNYDKSFYHDETKEAGGYSMEMINSEAVCFDDANWTASLNIAGGSPGIQNSVYDLSPDSSAPEILNVEAITDLQIKVTFNESMDVSTILGQNFLLSDGLIISNLDIQTEFGSEVLINLSTPFIRGTEYFLNLIGLTDCTGNALPTTNEVFYLGAAPSLHELIITEIMATPGPSSGLPENEYVELYNPTSSILALEGIILSDDNRSITLSAYNLYPDSYLILSDNNDVAALSSYGNTLGSSSFPTLAIADRVRIESPSNELIFEVNYDKSFYHDETKEAGGYSMEMINSEAVCFDDANWTASLNITGGSPGIQNSVYDLSPDSSAPEILNVEAITDLQIKVTFNESMDVSTIIGQNFLLSDGLIISNLDIQTEFGSEVLINLSTPFIRGTEYFLNLIGLTDCTGNALPTTSEAFYLGAAPSLHELIITEIMADPSPAQGLPEVEYLEVYNTSDKILALGGISLSDKTGSTTIPELSISPGSYLILAPISVASLLSGYGDVLALTGWRNLNSEGDYITLSFNNNLIFQVFYTDEWYRSSQKAEGGFSLEMIDRDYPCSEELNWKASENNNGGSPGTINSVDGNNPDIQGPSLTSAIAISDSQIQLTFDEKLSTDNIGVSNFNSSPTLNINAISIGTTKRSILLTTDLLQENTVYNIAVDNISDCTGNLIQTNGKDISLIIPALADSLDIVVNEVLFNPNTGGVRFIELYNTSTNYINLSNWAIAGHNNQKLITSENVIIYPMSYKVLTTDQTTLKDHYPNGQESTFIILNTLPNLSSTEGSVTLIDNLEQTIDHMNYSEDYHSQLLYDFNGISLEKIRPASSSINPNNWVSASSLENFATPGYINSQFQLEEKSQGNITVQPGAFAPNVPGLANFTTLNFSFEKPGNIINVTIYDTSGKVIKELTKNSLVSTSGFFRWDGTNERGAKARVGYYMILFEIISPEGKVSIVKEKVAIGGRF